MKKKFLFFMPALKVGGAEKVVQQVIIGLYREYDCHLVYIDYERPGDILQFPNDLASTPLSAKRTRFALLELFRIIKAIKPDIVFSSWSRSNLLLLTLRYFLPKSIKFVIREPNLPSYALPLLGSNNVYSWLYKTLYPKSDLIICQSQEMKQELFDLFNVPEGKLKVIYNMVPIEHVNKKSLLFDDLIEIRPDDVISCGRLDWQKGFDLLISSFSMVAIKHSSVRLIIFGEGPQRASLLQQINELGLNDRVVLPGETSNPYFYMKNSSTYVSSSRWEGLPNTVLEAMACGSNILASNCPGATGEIIEHGINGWLVRSNDVDSLATGIDKCLSGEWRTNSEHVVISANNYDIKNVIPKYEEAFLSVFANDK